MFKHLTSLLVANACYGCDRHLTIQEKHLCFNCLSQMEETGFHENPHENELFYRLAGRVPIEGAYGLFYFSKGGRLQTILQYLKYKGAPNLGIFLGEYYGHILTQNGLKDDFEAILPVPLHRSRLISRGYNQAEKIAIGLSRSMDIPLLKNKLFRRKRTLTQTRKGGMSRWGNVQDAFGAKPGIPNRILLVDDVITTGSTLEACVRAIKKSPHSPESISVLSIGVAKRD